LIVIVVVQIHCKKTSDIRHQASNVNHQTSDITIEKMQTVCELIGWIIVIKVLPNDKVEESFTIEGISRDQKSILADLSKVEGSHAFDSMVSNEK